MKDLTLKKDEKKDYILDIVKDSETKEDTLRVIYADGGYNKLVENTPGNIKLAETKMEQQAKTAVQNIKHFQNKVTLDKLCIAVHATAPAGAAYILNSNFDLCQNTPETLMLATGAVTLAGIIPWLTKLIKDKSRLSEVKKIKYRDDNREKLESFKDHCNSLNNLKQKTIRNLTREENPFGIRNLDNLSQATLEEIIANIDREEKMPFTYAQKVR